MQLKLLSTKKEAGDATSFIFEPDAPLKWKTGEYVHYKLPHENADNRGDERWFTISSAPFEKHIMLTTRFAGDKASSFKKRLFAMKPGEEIEAKGSEGDFIIDEPDKECIFIVGGIGVTPYRSIILDLDNKGAKIKGKMLYGNKDENIVFKEELEEVAKRHPEFEIRYFIGDKHVDAEAIRSAAPDLKSPIFYVSGPEPMVEAFEKTFLDLEIPQENTRRDYFPGYTWP